MKNTIFIVSLLSAVIILVVITITFFKENPDISLSRDYSSQDYSDYTPIPDLEFDFSIVTEEINIWKELDKLKATEAPEIPLVTDEYGNPVAGPANPETDAESDSDSDSDSDSEEAAETAVTEVTEK